MVKTRQNLQINCHVQKLWLVKIFHYNYYNIMMILHNSWKSFLPPVLIGKNTIFSSDCLEDNMVTFSYQSKKCVWTKGRWAGQNLPWKLSVSLILKLYLLVKKGHKKLFQTLPVHVSVEIRDFHFLWHTSTEYISVYLQNHLQMQPKVHTNTHSLWS